jgi:replication factor A1
LKIEEFNVDKPSRGRPRGHQSYSSMSVLSSVAQIAAKYNLDPKLLLDALTVAWIDEESQYEQLKIKCRKVNQDFATLLITCNDKVVWQSPVQIKILQEHEFLKSYIPIVPALIRKEDSMQKKISDLRNKMRGITVTGKILEVPPKMLVNTRYGWEAYVSNVLLADKTGTIRLSLWNNQINDVAVGDTVSIENAKVSTYYGEPQLRIGRSGTMSINTTTRESIAI